MQRFLAICLLALAAGLTWMASLMPRLLDGIISALFALTCLGGAVTVAWWMSRAGARRIERRGDRLWLQTVGLIGRTRTIEMPITDCRRLCGPPRVVRGPSGPLAGWAVTLQTSASDVFLGFMPGGHAAKSNPDLLAELLETRFEVKST